MAGGVGGRPEKGGLGDMCVKCGIAHLIKVMEKNDRREGKDELLWIGEMVVRQRGKGGIYLYHMFGGVKLLICRCVA